jgi:hypothetical protein
VNQELMLLWRWDSSGTQGWEPPPLKADTRGLVKDSRMRRLNACVVNADRELVIALGCEL